MTKMVNEIYFSKAELNIQDEFKKSIKAFLSNKSEDTLFSKALNNSFNNFKKLLEKRFVPLKNDICFDKKVAGCWPYLCSEDYQNYRNELIYHLFL